MRHEWRPVPGYEGIYEIRQGKDGGRVRRVQPLARTRVGRELFGIDGYGYPRAVLTGADGNVKYTRMHVLIMRAFGPPQPCPLHVVLHKDDVKKHNVIGNLVWGTKSQNLLDSWVNKRRKACTPAGAAHPRSKLTPAQAKRIRLSKKPLSELAVEMGVSKQTVWRVRTRKSY